MTDRQFKQSVAVLRSSRFLREGVKVVVNSIDKDYFGRPFRAVYVYSYADCGFTGPELQSIANCFGLENVIFIDSHFVNVCIYIELSK